MNARESLVALAAVATVAAATWIASAPGDGSDGGLGVVVRTRASAVPQRVAAVAASAVEVGASAAPAYAAARALPWPPADAAALAAWSGPAPAAAPAAAPVAAAASAAAAVLAAAPAAPVAAPPLRLIGVLQRGAGPTALLDGAERSVAVQAGDVIDGAWRVDAVHEDRVDLWSLAARQPVHVGYAQ